MKFTNPIISGFHPDPSICRVEDDYYLVTSSFEYFPGVPIFHSKDLIHWKQLGHCLTRESQLSLANAWRSGGIYAPTIRFHDGWFYMTTTNVSGHGNFYVKSRDPKAQWSEPFLVDQGGIDPSLLFDEDGRVYFQSAMNGSEGNGIYQCEIDIETGRKLTPSRLIWAGTGGAHPEAPHLYKLNGKYYLMIAEGGTEYGHMETIARSEHPYGPFESCPHNPILSHRSFDSIIQATGHADLVQAADNSWWAVCLGIRPVGYPKRHHLGREVFLAPVTWSNDGWPIIGKDGKIDPIIDSSILPNFPVSDHIENPVRDDFDDEELDVSWTFLRNPAECSWSLSERKGYLVLHGNSIDLDHAGAPSFVGRRLSHLTCRIATLLDYEPMNEEEEAGLTVFMNEHYHYDIIVRRTQGNKQVVLRKRVASMITEHSLPCEVGSIELMIDVQPEVFLFSYRQGEGSPKVIGSGETHLLSTEVAGGFTGVFIAMYAYSAAVNGMPAAFDWFDYEPVENKK